MHNEKIHTITKKNNDDETFKIYFNDFKKSQSGIFEYKPDQLTKINTNTKKFYESKSYFEYIGQSYSLEETFGETTFENLVHNGTTVIDNSVDAKHILIFTVNKDYIDIPGYGNLIDFNFELLYGSKIYHTLSSHDITINITNINRIRTKNDNVFVDAETDYYLVLTNNNNFTRIFSTDRPLINKIKLDAGEYRIYYNSDTLGKIDEEIILNVVNQIPAEQDTYAVFNIIKNDLGYSANMIRSGNVYSVDDKILIKGELLNGLNGVNDCTINADSIDTYEYIRLYYYGIKTFSISGDGKNTLLKIHNLGSAQVNDKITTIFEDIIIDANITNIIGTNIIIDIVVKIPINNRIKFYKVKDINYRIFTNDLQRRLGYLNKKTSYTFWTHFSL